MATTKFSGNPVSLKGELITVGAKAPDFQLVKSDLSNFSLKDAAGKFLVLNIFPSLDTSVCATSVRKFNQYAAALPNTLVLAISMDLPFAQKRFCTAEGIENVIPLSAFRSDFGKAYGLQISDSVFEGLLARAVVIVTPEGKVSYVELVPEITTEPNYEAALSSIKK